MLIKGLTKDILNTLQHHEIHNLLDKLNRFGKTMPSGCIEWTGHRMRARYGQVGLVRPEKRYTLYTHRVSYRCNVGEIYDGLLVCHRCDNPACINHNHLFLGTQKDNVQDMIRKGRKGCPDKKKRRQPVKASL